MDRKKNSSERNLTASYRSVLFQYMKVNFTLLVSAVSFYACNPFAFVL
jgi:hypothetical protein